MHCKLLVEIDRRVDFFHDRVGAVGEPAAPHLVAHWFRFQRSGMSDQNPPKRGLPAPAISIIALGLVLAFVYVMKGLHRNEPAPGATACPAARAIAARLAPLVKGEVAALALDSQSAARCRR